MTNKEFNIKNREETFRVGKISPIELMAIATQVDFEKLEQTTNLITFCLEHTEVKVGEKWLPVKTKGREIYWPQGIDEDLLALTEIFNYIMEKVVAESFTKSSE